LAVSGYLPGAKPGGSVNMAVAWPAALTATVTGVTPGNENVTLPWLTTPPLRLLTFAETATVSPTNQSVTLTVGGLRTGRAPLASWLVSVPARFVGLSAGWTAVSAASIVLLPALRALGKWMVAVASPGLRGLMVAVTGGRPATVNVTFPSVTG